MLLLALFHHVIKPRPTNLVMICLTLVVAIKEDKVIIVMVIIIKILITLEVIINQLVIIMMDIVLQLIMADKDLREGVDFLIEVVLGILQDFLIRELVIIVEIIIWISMEVVVMVAINQDLWVDLLHLCNNNNSNNYKTRRSQWSLKNLSRDILVD